MSLNSLINAFLALNEKIVAVVKKKISEIKCSEHSMVMPSQSSMKALMGDWLIVSTNTIGLHG